MSKTVSKPKKKNRRSGSDLHPRVMISGYYGFDNLGDELILRVLIEDLKEKDVQVTVLSNDPHKTAREYGVEAIRRTSLIDIIDALTRTNLFISGGGGLFQDATGPMSAIYYGGLIHLAHFFEVPVCFWAQGVGPLTGKWPRRITASALRHCEVITVRDEKSAALVEDLIDVTPEITADPVWLLKMPKKKPAAKPLRKKGRPYDNLELLEDPPLRVGVSLRPWPELTEDHLQALARCLLELYRDHSRPIEWLLLPFQKREDTEPLQRFAEFLAMHDGRNEITLVEPNEVVETVGACDVLFGMRFHSLILGLLADVPVYGLVYDPKVASLLEMFQLQGTAISDLGTMKAEAIQDYLSNYPAIDLKPFRKQSRRNVAILNELLEIPEAELVL